MRFPSSACGGILYGVLLQVAELGEVTIQIRKTFVSLVGPRRAFAMVQPTTKTRVDLGLRIVLPTDAAPARLQPATSLGRGIITSRIGPSSAAEIDDEVAHWLLRSYEANLYAHAGRNQVSRAH